MRDIDDVLALLFLFASPEVKVEGVTATYGNASLKNTYRLAKRTCEFAGRDEVPVLSGAAGAKDRGKMTPAVEFIIKYFRRNAGNAMLLTLGPLTNLATALMFEPRLAEWIPATVMMGGNLRGVMPFGPFSKFEFNFALDWKAADLVLRSPLKKWIATADLCMQSRFGYHELSRLRKLNPRSAADRLCPISEWIMLNRPVLKHGFCPWDPIAAAMIAKPELFGDAQPMNIVMENKGMVKSIHDAGEGQCSAPTIVPMKLDSAGFMDLLIERLSCI